MGVNCVSRWMRFDWLSTRWPRRRRSAKRGHPVVPFFRRLRFEPLEDRRVLTTITVDTLIDIDADDGLTTLREAIAAAMSNDTIDFAVTGTINLSNLGQLIVNKSLTIDGPGANLLTINAYDPTPATKNGDGSRVMYTRATGAGNVTISGLTLTGGDVFGEGGAIGNRGNLTITACTISDNSATFPFSAGSSGGAIDHSPLSSGDLLVNQSTISGNSADRGGGLYTRRGYLTVTESTISGNQAMSGGGIYNYYGNHTITGSTISGNSASDFGGGIRVKYAGLTITSSTISGNSATVGGGLFVAGNATLAHSTVAFNNVTGFGKGIFLLGGQVVPRHSIIAQNIGPNGDVNGLLGEVIDPRYSLIGNNEGSGLAAAPVGSPDFFGNLIGTQFAPIDPLLGPLAENGGPTMTHALLTGSPAIDAGDPMFTPPPDYDQRGNPFGRVVDGDAVPSARIDIGAFELQPIPPAFYGDYNENNVVDAADNVIWRATLGTVGVPAYSGADGDGDTTIDPDDYGVWQAHFGQTVPMAGSGASLEQGAGSLEQGAGSLSFSRDPAGSAEQVRGQETHAQQEAELPISDFGLRFGESRESGRPAAQVPRSRAPEQVAGSAWRLRDDAILAWLASGGEKRAVEAGVLGQLDNDEAIRFARDRAFESLEMVRVDEALDTSLDAHAK